MKTTVYFVFTCFVSTFAFFGALGAKNPFPCFGIAFCIWALFIWGCSRRAKKDAEKRFQERMFSEFMRSRMRQPNRR